jgi:hypothetical protein
MNNTHTKSILTIAIGGKLYIDMACNLAMSFLMWNKNSSISFFLVTDKPEYIPEFVRSQITIIKRTADELGKGFSSKLQLAELVQTDQTLFIDADCLIYGNLSDAFAVFEGESVSAIGYKRYQGIDIGSCANIKDVLEKNGLGYFPLFCGSVYYVQNNDIAQSVFHQAKVLLKSYDALGLVRLRNRENEEPLMAMAMAKFLQNPVNDTGLIKADRMYYDYMESNILRGYAKLWNGIEPSMKEYSTLMISKPLIVHFNAYNNELYEYRSEVIRLRNVFLKNRPFFAANLYAYLTCFMPGWLVKNFKNTLRPIYNSIFGYRKIKASERIVAD